MTLNCQGQLIDLTAPKIMGILNITPDSFYEGSRFSHLSQALKQAEKMQGEGADFIDIGGYSSKPGADFVSENEELSRVLPLIEAIHREFPHLPVSIDTFRSAVAKKAVEAGAALINDISAGLLDVQMLETVAQLRVPYIMMHLKGNPQTMQSLAQYDNLIGEILFYFSERIAAARALGISDLVADPGFGFAKTLEQNYALLRQCDAFKILDLPILIGISRKSMIYKLLGTTPDHAQNGTTALNMIALSKGANILRVHDVKEAAECVKIWQQLNA